MKSNPLKTWTERLEFLQDQLARTEGAARFGILKDIEQAKTMIAELGGTVPETTNVSETDATPAQPSKPVLPPPPAGLGQTSSMDEPQRQGKHVFLSHSREDRPIVDVVRKAILANGNTVWWDRDLLPGQNWKHEIRQELRKADAFVLCLSKAMEQRVRSGAFPEIRDAIATYRELTPGGIFIIPVRLNECNVPPFEIDATTMLDDLQYVDLFPESEWQPGLERLLAALK